VAPNWLGDAVMSRGLIGMLAAAGTRVSVLAAPYVSRLYAGMPEVSALYVDSSPSRMRRIRDRAGVLRAARPDAALLLPPSFSSALPPWLARVAVRCGDAGDGRRPLLSDRLDPPATREEHLYDTFERIGRGALGRLGVGVPAAWSPAAIALSPRDEAEARTLLSGLGISGAFAVVVPGAAYGPAKSWQPERFRALCARLGAGMPVVLAGSERERPLAERVGGGIKGVHVACGRTSLGGFLALLASASVVVANDSGSPHASAALGRPTVVLFGSTSPAWTAPRGPRVEILHHRVHCNPCFRRTCPTQLECFAGIEVEDVLAAALRAVREGAASGAANPA
jgi:heptosyltransferase-2